MTENGNPPSMLLGQPDGPLWEDIPTSRAKVVVDEIRKVVDDPRIFDGLNLGQLLKVQRVALRFYRESNSNSMTSGLSLYRVQARAEAEASPDHRYVLFGTCYALGIEPALRAFYLDGSSAPIHRANAVAPIDIPIPRVGESAAASAGSDVAKEYLRFFCHFVCGESGPFYPIERASDVVPAEPKPASPEAMDDGRAATDGGDRAAEEGRAQTERGDGSTESAGPTAEQVGEAEAGDAPSTGGVEKSRDWKVDWSHPDIAFTGWENDQYLFEACLLYGQDRFLTEFTVKAPSGAVDMRAEQAEGGPKFDPLYPMRFVDREKTTSSAARTSPDSNLEELPWDEFVAQLRSGPATIRNKIIRNDGGAKADRGPSANSPGGEGRASAVGGAAHESGEKSGAHQEDRPRAGGEHVSEKRVRRAVRFQQCVFDVSQDPDSFLFAGFEFDHPLVFDRCIFKRRADFSNAVFQGSVQFADCAFLYGLDFSNATLKQSLQVIRCMVDNWSMKQLRPRFFNIQDILDAWQQAWLDEGYTPQESGSGGLDRPGDAERRSPVRWERPRQIKNVAPQYAILLAGAKIDGLFVVMHSDIFGAVLLSRMTGDPQVLFRGCWCYGDITCVRSEISSLTLDFHSYGEGEGGRLPEVSGNILVGSCRCGDVQLFGLSVGGFLTIYGGTSLGSFRWHGGLERKRDRNRLESGDVPKPALVGGGVYLAEVRCSAKFEMRDVRVEPSKAAVELMGTDEVQPWEKLAFGKVIVKDCSMGFDLAIRGPAASELAKREFRESKECMVRAVHGIDIEGVEVGGDLDLRGIDRTGPILIENVGVGCNVRCGLGGLRKQIEDEVRQRSLQEERLPDRVGQLALARTACESMNLRRVRVRGDVMMDGLELGSYGELETASGSADSDVHALGAPASIGRDGGGGTSEIGRLAILSCEITGDLSLVVEHEWRDRESGRLVIKNSPSEEKKRVAALARVDRLDLAGTSCTHLVLSGENFVRRDASENSTRADVCFQRFQCKHFQLLDFPIGRSVSLQDIRVECWDFRDATASGRPDPGHVFKSLLDQDRERSLSTYRSIERWFLQSGDVEKAEDIHKQKWNYVADEAGRRGRLGKDLQVMMWYPLVVRFGYGWPWTLVLAALLSLVTCTVLLSQPGYLEASLDYLDGRPSSSLPPATIADALLVAVRYSFPMFSLPLAENWRPATTGLKVSMETIMSVVAAAAWAWWVLVLLTLSMRVLRSLGLRSDD